MTAAWQPPFNPPQSDDSADLVAIETVEADRVRASVKVLGDLDIATAPTLFAVLQAHLAAGRRFLRLDVAGVTFLDAAALTGITGIHHAALARRGTLVLTGVAERTARVLRLAGLDDVLFVGGPRSDDDLDAPGSDERHRVFPARLVPWTPLAALHDAAADD
ncbi:MAG TPA: STAS domain-containing protein [Jatrophihabitans sp.]|nr:STAS domain-containing protein [Jatrophihabitans sp.]